LIAGPLIGPFGTQWKPPQTGGAAVRSSERPRLPKGNGLGSLNVPVGGFIGADRMAMKAGQRDKGRYIETADAFMHASLNE
jgi:hypothetical protein